MDIQMLLDKRRVAIAANNTELVNELQAAIDIYHKNCDDATRVSLAIQYNLNEVNLIMVSNPTLAQQRIKFVKYLIHNHSNNLSQLVDVSELWFDCMKN